MKKLVLLVAVFVIALLVVPAAIAITQCTPVQQLNQERLQVKSDFSNYRAERHMFGMDAIIDYAKEQGKDTAELAQLRTQFEAKNSELQEAATAGNQNQYNELIQEMKQITTQFREEAGNQVALGDRDQARDKVQQKLQEQETHLNGLLSTAYKNGQSHMRARFDAATCVAENAMERLRNKGADVDDLESDLDEIKAKKAGLGEKMEAAAIACADTPYGLCKAAEKAEYEAAKEEMLNEFAQFRNQYKEKVQAQLKTGTSDTSQGQGQGGNQ